LGFGDWLKRLFGLGGRSTVMVPYFDVETGRVVQIPASELRPGVIRAQVQGIDGLVWLLPDQLSQGEIQHPPFDEDVRVYIRKIHEAFEEHRSLSFDEWEEGFRRDTNPAQEIAMWSHAADVYTAFAEGESSAERRRDVYRCIVACLSAPPNMIWNVVELSELSRTEAEQVVHQFYGEGA
jgi:hypothetical protein